MEEWRIANTNGNIISGDETMDVSADERTLVAEDYKEALRELERVVARQPWARDARLALAAFRREAGDAAGAEKLLRELAAINPGDPALAAARRVK